MTEKEKIYKIAFDHIAKFGIVDFSIKELATVNNISITKIKKFFNTDQEMLYGFIQMINENVLKEISSPNLEKIVTKDTLFEYIMVRFDKLLPYKEGLEKIYNELKTKPKLLNLISKKIYNFIESIFNLSGAKRNFIFDKISINTLFLIYVYVFNIWLKDNTSEMSKTMSELDLCLSRAEMVIKRINLF